MNNNLVNTKRSAISTNPEILTTFNSSFLIPLKVFQVVPNGTYKMTIGTICRLPALKVPVMGKLWLEVFAFYVPYTLVFKKFDKFLLEGHDNTFDEDTFGLGSHTPNTESKGKSIVPDLLMPKLVSTVAGATGFPVKSGDLLNRLGLPIANQDAHDRSIAKNKKLRAELDEKYKDVQNGRALADKEYNEKKVRVVPVEIPNGKYSAASVRAYYEILNKSFRSKFLEDPEPTDYGETTSDPKNFELKRVNRSDDWVSRGFVGAELNEVTIPLGGDIIPVSADNNGLAPTGLLENGSNPPRFFAETHEFVYSDAGTHSHRRDYKYDTQNYLFSSLVADGSADAKFYTNHGGGDAGHFAGVANIAAISPYVDLKNAIAMNMNDLRYLIGLSHVSEKALWGTDMSTYLKMNFNLNVPKTDLDEPYLFGYKKVPVEINQVTQTAPSGDGTSNIGDVYGQSTTVRRVDDGSFSFRAHQHGLIMLCCCIRHESVYQYGIDPHFLVDSKFDLLTPDLLGLSNQPLPKQIIYFTGTPNPDEEVFNFNEPFSALDHDLNVVNGEFSSDSDTPLDFYHLADIYNSAPSYDATWIKDTTKEVLDRALTVTSSVADQVHAYFKVSYNRVIPKPRYHVGMEYI